MQKIKKCSVCEKELICISPNQKRCVDCQKKKGYLATGLKKKICKKCSKKFTPNGSQQKYCLECKKKVCLFCNKEYTAMNQNQRFCSRYCVAKYYYSKKLAKVKRKGRKKERITKKCILCNKLFRVPKSRGKAKYCSKECWTKRNPPIEIFCNLCGRTFTTYSRTQRFCSKKCHCKWRRGRKLSEEHKKKIAKSHKGKMPKNYITHILSHIHNRKGKKLEEIYGIEKTKKIKERLRQFRQNQHIPKRPTLPEKQFIKIIDIMNLPFAYVGNGKKWIGRKNPDFIHKSKKIVIEIFGKYWHKKDEVDNYKNYYQKYGYKCFIIWDYEVENFLREINKITVIS